MVKCHWPELLWHVDIGPLLYSAIRAKNISIVSSLKIFTPWASTICLGQYLFYLDPLIFGHLLVVDVVVVLAEMPVFYKKKCKCRRKSYWLIRSVHSSSGKGRWYCILVFTVCRIVAWWIFFQLQYTKIQTKQSFLIHTWRCRQVATPHTVTQGFLYSGEEAIFSPEHRKNTQMRNDFLWCAQVQNWTL